MNSGSDFLRLGREQPPLLVAEHVIERQSTFWSYQNPLPNPRIDDKLLLHLAQPERLLQGRAGSLVLPQDYLGRAALDHLPARADLVPPPHEVRDELRSDEEARPVVPPCPRDLGDVIHGHGEVGLARAWSLLHERPSLVDDHRLPPAVVLRPADQAPDGRQRQKQRRVPQLRVLDVVQHEDHLVIEGGLSPEEELVGREAGLELLPQALRHDGIQLLDVRDLPRGQVELVEVLPFGKVEDVADESCCEVAVAEDAEGV